MRVDRERVLRTLTFWLRPDFLLRCARRFSLIAGFDRSIALASSAFTALIPLTIFAAALVPRTGDEATADRIIDRFDLTGDGAQAVRDAFPPSADLDTGLGLFGGLLLIVAVLSFTRAFQRLFEQAWGLPALSVRNTRNNLVWIAGFVAYAAVSGTIAATSGSGIVGVLARISAVLPLAVFLTWSGWILSARRLPWQRFVPGGLIAVPLLAVYTVAAGVYVPRLFSTYADRFGVIGVSFAMISWLFGFMFVQVVTTAAGREVWEEMQSIERGERPSRAEVDRQWAAARDQAEQARAQVNERAAAIRRRLRGLRDRL